MKLGDVSVKNKLRLLSVLFVGAILVFGLLAYRTLNRVKIGSATYQEIADSNTQLADYEPPTQFLLGARMLVYQMRVDMADKAKLASETESFRKAIKDFEDGHTHWMTTEEHQTIKDLMQNAYAPGHDFLELGINTYIPLLMDGKGAEADEFRKSRMNTLYAAHEKAMREFMTGMKEHLTMHENLAASESSSGLVMLIVVGLIASVVVAGLTFYIGNGIVTPLKQTVEVLDEVSRGNLTRRLEVKGQDEIAQMGNALNTTIDNLSRALTQISSDAGVLSSASEELSSTSQQLGNNSQQTTNQAAAVSAAAEQVSQNVQTVSTATEEMSASIKEISKNASEAAEVASSAARLAGSTTATMTKLSESSAEIGNVIKVITSIAEQTNLLALNATIEAARAGEAGKGFAVVANEVKELAKETAKATEDIGIKVEAIQNDAKGAVQAIEEITTVIGRINDIQNTIASAVEEQTGTTNEISRNISETAKGSSDIASNITGVAQAAKDTQGSASASQQAAEELSKLATSLSSVVNQFQLASNGHSSNGGRESRWSGNGSAHANGQASAARPREIHETQAA